MIEIDRKQSLFEVCSQRQPEWCPASDSNIELFDQAIALGTLNAGSYNESFYFRFVHSLFAESGESEEEFEILG
jgi:hypothetical protein